MTTTTTTITTMADFTVHAPADAAPPTAAPPSVPAYRIRKATHADVPLLGDIERSAGQVFRAVGLDAVADDEPMPAEVLASYLDAGHLWVATTASGTSTGVDSGTTVKHAVDDTIVGFLACFPIIKHPTSSNATQHDAEKTPLAHLHIAELSVHAAHQKRGLGKRLMDAMTREVTPSPYVPIPSRSASESESASASNPTDQTQKARIRGFSLTTYRHLPFNAPFYRRLGFVEVAPTEIAGVVGQRGRELWEQEQAGIMMPERRCWMVRQLEEA